MINLPDSYKTKLTGSETVNSPTRLPATYSNQYKISIDFETPVGFVNDEKQRILVLLQNVANGSTQELRCYKKLSQDTEHDWFEITVFKIDAKDIPVGTYNVIILIEDALDPDNTIRYRRFPIMISSSL